MLNYLIIIHRSSGLPLFSKGYSQNFLDIQSALLSGILVALKQITNELKIGELSTFNTHNQKIITRASENIFIGLILDTDDSEQIWNPRAQLIAELFEKRYDMANWYGSADLFDDFEAVLTDLIKGFVWKDKKLENIDLNFVNLDGFFLFDRNKMEYFYNYSDESIKTDYVLNRIESINEDVTINFEDLIYNFLLHNNYGAVLIYNSRTDAQLIKRSVKTAKFIIENLFNTYRFKPDMKKAACALFKPDIVENIEKNSNNTVLNVLLNYQQPLFMIENIRKFALRSLVIID